MPSLAPTRRAGARAFWRAYFFQTLPPPPPVPTVTTYAAAAPEALKQGETIGIGPGGQRGVWRTVNGRAIFIEVREGESVPQAVRRTEKERGSGSGDAGAGAEGSGHSGVSAGPGAADAGAARGPAAAVGQRTALGPAADRYIAEREQKGDYSPAFARGLRTAVLGLPTGAQDWLEQNWTEKGSGLPVIREIDLDAPETPGFLKSAFATARAATLNGYKILYKKGTVPEPDDLLHELTHVAIQDLRRRAPAEVEEAVQGGEAAGRKLITAAFSKQWRTKTPPEDDEGYRAWYGAKYVRNMAASVRRYLKHGKTDVTGALELDLMIPPGDVRHLAKAIGVPTEGASDQWHVVATYAGLAKHYNATLSDAYRDEELVTYRAGTDRRYAERLFGALRKPGSYAFDESEHPRHGKGSPEGGRFAPAGEGGGETGAAEGGRVAARGAPLSSWRARARKTRTALGAAVATEGRKLVAGLGGRGAPRVVVLTPHAAAVDKYDYNTLQGAYDGQKNVIHLHPDLDRKELLPVLAHEYGHALYTRAGHVAHGSPVQRAATSFRVAVDEAPPISGYVRSIGRKAMLDTFTDETFAEVLRARLTDGAFERRIAQHPAYVAGVALLKKMRVLPAVDTARAAFVGHAAPETHTVYLDEDWEPVDKAQAVRRVDLTVGPGVYRKEIHRLDPAREYALAADGKSESPAFAPDYARIEQTLDLLQEQLLPRLQRVFREAKDKLRALVERRAAGGGLDFRFVQSLEFRGLGDLVPLLRAYLQATFLAGRREAGSELARLRGRRFAYRIYAGLANHPRCYSADDRREAMLAVVDGEAVHGPCQTCGYVSETRMGICLGCFLLDSGPLAVWEGVFLAGWRGEHPEWPRSAEAEAKGYTKRVYQASPFLTVTDPYGGRARVPLAPAPPAPGGRPPRAGVAVAEVPPEAAIRYFEDKALAWRGILADDLLTDIKRVLLGSLANGEPLAETMAALERTFSPYVGDQAALPDQEQTQPYRLETLIRTTSTEAFNAGRKDAFADAVADGFVTGYEYTAVLDTRTTDVCRFLHGKILPPAGEQLDRLAPPRHFNCRSLLSPVTRVENPSPDFISDTEFTRGIALSGKGFSQAARARAYASDAREFSSTQVNLPPTLDVRFRAWVQENLSPEDLSSEETQDDVAHVTVLYGLHGATAKPVAEAVAGTGPIVLTLGPVARFEAERYDVLYVAVESRGLRALRDRLTSLPHTATQPTYTPHATLAYVRKGAGARLLGDRTFAGTTVVVDRLRFSSWSPTAGVTWVPLLPGPRIFSTYAIWDEDEHPRDEQGRFVEKAVLDAARNVARKVADAGAQFAADRAFRAMAKLPPRAATKIAETLRRVFVRKGSGASYGAGILSLGSVYQDKDYLYETYDSVYRESVRYDAQYVLTHELGHAAAESLSAEERDSWRALTGWKRGKELDAAGVKKVPVPLPDQFKKRKEFRKGGIWDWDRIGWTYEGYRRRGDYVHADQDAAGRWRIESVSEPVGGTVFLPAGAQRPPTAYGGTNSAEEFAEAFTLYHLDRKKLRARRPDMADWMDRWHRE